MKHQNPFEYDAAPNLPPDDLVEWYIKDNNFSRFIESSRNILINGERGSGKSMALIYNSLPYQLIRHNTRLEDFPPQCIGIYIPCNTPLTHKKEHLLLSEYESKAISEHFLISGIGTGIAKNFLCVDSMLERTDSKSLIEEFSYLRKEKPSQDILPFSFLRRSFYQQMANDQRKLNEGLAVDVELEVNAFYSVILPILEAIRQTQMFKNAHLSLMFDDAHDLNQHQRETLNSWLGYRDHSVFSFKVAIAGVKYYDLRTSYGGTLLEGHDFITLDLEKAYQNESSSFGKFAYEVVSRRLMSANIEISVDDFFPEDQNFVLDIQKYKEITRQEAIERGYTSQKAITDYVYKYARARYFQQRSPKANKPTYAGFNTLVHLSTGVVRNLLNPCYWMFEKLISDNGDIKKGVRPIDQSEIIFERSEKQWNFIKNQLPICIEGCGTSEAEQLISLFESLAEYFRNRLLNHKSEPRVLIFTISAYTHDLQEKLTPIFRLAQKAQLLYIRSGPAKDGGKIEDYYTLNRILWPAYGLDVVGQHGRASIQALHLWNATKGISIPMSTEEELVGQPPSPYQLELK